MGIPVINFTPSKGNDKHTRVNSVSPLFESWPNMGAQRNGVCSGSD